MGFTIQDMLIVSRDQYQMELVAGEKGWANSISWVMMVEDTAILRHFSGKELAVTTGLGFGAEERLMLLARKLVENHAAGLIINTGKYIMEIPSNLANYCNENDLPLITVPWEIYLADMIKELSIHVFMQGAADEQIDNAMIGAIENPSSTAEQRKILLPYYDVEGTFQIIAFSTEGLGEMDTVERRKLSYRLQIYLENITHNGKFFYYDTCFILVLNDVSKKDQVEILEGMMERSKRRMPEHQMYVGVGSVVHTLEELQITYRRARSALHMAMAEQIPKVDFDNMGMHRLYYSVSDTLLLREISEESLKDIIAYDKKHDADYLLTLELYLKNNGSIQAVSEQMFTHRNTVLYRIGNIKKLLDDDLSSAASRMRYQIAVDIYRMLQNSNV